MKAIVAMSGGVDSSVAAALMVEAGHDVIGITLKQWEDADGSLPTAGCCTVGDAEDARRVAAQLDIPYYVLDYVDEFRAAVVEPFGRGYLSGQTPNPCVECNRTVRFKALLERTADLGGDVLVTGHYARVRWHPAGYRLERGIDPAKDQSYVLYMLTQAELGRIRLPVGELTKPEVRAHARRLGLRTAGKPDSQEICFVGKGNYRNFLAEHFPETARPGPIVDAAGNRIGTHEGTAGFTIGQRRGLGIAVQEPRFVVDIDAPTATVVVGDRDDLLVGGCSLINTSFVAGRPPRDGGLQVKVRY
ncbi:MAG: tRNA 2-thiouridine(34) synthase MnmA, partial [Acidimicrobiia bacterium]|nr:tRNA 2-thiouridine(34) synthase MnmA [Acidimicrobiia bacterium]